MTIPASAFASVTPGVLGAGGQGVTLQGLFLSTNTRTPIGAVPSFPTAQAVGNYYGPLSTEASAAAIYFAGFDNSNIKPGSLLFAQYNESAVSGYLRGGSLSSMTLTQLQALTGTLTVTANGTVFTSGTITLTSDTSFSNAAATIQAAFLSPSFAVTFDSVASAFVFTDASTGATSTITFATGTLAAGLMLTQQTGAVLSQGAAPAVVASFMAGIVAVTRNWGTLVTLFDPDNGVGNTQKQAFAAWTTAQGDEFLYATCDADVTPLESNQATTSLGYILGANGTSGSALIGGTQDAYSKSAFVAGAIASIDFTQLNGRTTLAYRTQSGLTADVSSQTAMTNLLANGYNCYLAAAAADQGFNFFWNGAVTGPYEWIDSYVNQIWMSSGLQSAMMALLISVKSIPYNNAGYALIRSACADQITAALDFGAIRKNVALSALQIAEVNNAAGIAIDKQLSSVGYYLQILPPSAAVRAARGSPPMTLWYMDGGSVQSLNLASVMVQ